MGMHVADRTSRLRIGTAVTLGAFYHPLRIAEEVALLDVLSGGRVNWGIGRGFDKTEYAAFGVTPEQSYPRFREHLQIVEAAWTHHRLDYDGEFWHFDGIEVLPKPVQEPHPPIWVASTSPEAIEWSAQHGYAILMDPHSSHADIGRKRRHYDELMAEHHPDAPERDIPVARLLAVAPTTAEAEEIARRGAAWVSTSYANPGRNAPGAGAPSFNPEGVDPVERYVNEVVIWGTPEQVVDRVTELHETIQLDYLMCAPLSHSTFELFTDKVLPKLL
jgi:alkanesulfonate monooxygenase SsuD/methylene tetrahydromethanopterin reductase-like flavin-dependent oxidoreductase (luciferase family)